ncbi:MAG: amidohydrolase family protein [Verrucomicrobiota bacterium]
MSLENEMASQPNRILKTARHPANAGASGSLFYRHAFVSSGRPLCFGLCVLLLLWMAAAFFAAPILAAEAFLIKAGTVHTVTQGDLSPGEVLVRDGQIAAVGKNLDLRDAKVIDLSGAHVYPGLIAPTSSLGLVEIGAVRATQDMSEVGEYTPDVQSWIAVNPDSEHLPVARANGITHALAVPQGGIVSGTSGLIALDGWTAEDMAIRKLVGLHLFWPSMQLDTTPKERFTDKSRWKSLEDQANDRRKKLKSLNDFFEEAKAYSRARESGKLTAITPAWEAMLPVIKGQIPIFVHADEIKQIKAAVLWASEQGYKIILAGGRDAHMAATLLAEKKVPVIFEQVFDQPSRDRQAYDIHFKTPALLHQAGVRVALSQGLGSSAASHTRNLPYAAAQAVAFGFPAEEALKSLTLYPAEMLGVTNRLGSIEPGKEASLFAATGDILDIRSRVTRLWIAGKEVSLDTRHTRLYEKYRNRPAR